LTSEGDCAQGHTPVCGLQYAVKNDGLP